MMACFVAVLITAILVLVFVLTTLTIVHLETRDALEASRSEEERLVDLLFDRARREVDATTYDAYTRNRR